MTPAFSSARHAGRGRAEPGFLCDLWRHCYNPLSNVRRPSFPRVKANGCLGRALAIVTGSFCPAVAYHLVVAMLSNLRRSRRGVATIIAEVMMVLIVILMSAIVYIWVVPAFTSQASHDNAGAAYSEKFETVRAQFATYVVSIPETVAACGSQDTNVGCTPSGSYTTCNGSISSPVSGDVLVPVNGACLITSTVSGDVIVYTGGNLTVIGGTINGGLEADHSSSVTLKNASVGGFTGLYNVQTVIITGTRFNTSGNLSICTDACGAAMYAGGRGSFTMTNSTLTGQIENEVGHQTYFVGNHISGRLEVESADQGSIISNTVGSLDLDQNGAVVIASNTVNGSVKYGLNRWCGTGYNVILGGTTGVCVGNVEVDVINTGSIPVNFVSVYMTNIPFAGALSWQLASGNQVRCGTTQSVTCTQLPIIIPVGEMAQITVGWTPPASAFPLPWNYIYFIFVSSHQNFVDGYLYFSTGLGLPMQSRLENRICPPCW